MSDETTPAPATDGVTDVDSGARAIFGLLGGAEDAPADDQAEAGEPARAERGDSENETAPAERPPGGNEEDRPDPAAAQPPVEAPSSYTDAEKEAFRALPPAVQQAVARRERERTTEVRRRQDELAEQRRTIDAERQAITNERAHYAQQLGTLVPALQQQLQTEFPDIKTVTDLQRLATEDPARYIQWDAKQRALQAARQELGQQEQLRQREHDGVVKARLAEEAAKLVEAIPDWQDEAKGRQGRQELTSYLTGVGFAPREIEQAADHRIVVLARKAMLYDRAQQDLAKAADRPPVPKVQAPGAGNGKGNGAARDATYQRLRRSGRVEDAAALIESIL